MTIFLCCTTFALAVSGILFLNSETSMSNQNQSGIKSFVSEYPHVAELILAFCSHNENASSSARERLLLTKRITAELFDVDDWGEFQRLLEKELKNFQCPIGT